MKTTNEKLLTALRGDFGLERSRDGKKWSASKGPINTGLYFYRAAPQPRIWEIGSGDVLVKGVGIDDRRLSLRYLRVLVKLALRRKRATIQTEFGEGFVNQSGDVTIGCQRYSFKDEILPFAKQKGWV